MEIINKIEKDPIEIWCYNYIDSIFEDYNNCPKSTHFHEGGYKIEYFFRGHEDKKGYDKIKKYLKDIYHEHLKRHLDIIKVAEKYTKNDYNIYIHEIVKYIHEPTSTIYYTVVVGCTERYDDDYICVNFDNRIYKEYIN